MPNVELRVAIRVQMLLNELMGGVSMKIKRTHGYVHERSQLFGSKHHCTSGIQFSILPMSQQSNLLDIWLKDSDKIRSVNTNLVLLLYFERIVYYSNMYIIYIYIYSYVSYIMYKTKFSRPQTFLSNPTPGRKLELPVSTYLRDKRQAKPQGGCMQDVSLQWNSNLEQNQQQIYVAGKLKLEMLTLKGIDSVNQL